MFLDGRLFKEKGRLRGPVRVSDTPHLKTHLKSTFFIIYKGRPKSIHQSIIKSSAFSVMGLILRGLSNSLFEEVCFEEGGQFWGLRYYIGYSGQS